MPVRKKQDTTPQNTAVPQASAEPVIPGPERFQDFLRAEIRQATRLVMEEIMCEELTQFVGAEWGENSPERKGYRNGYYTRDLRTTNGAIENLKVPRDREGEFQTQVFDRYARYEPQIEQGLTEMFVSGTSTQKVGKVVETMIGVTPSASAVSRLNQSLTEKYKAWRDRPLQDQYRVIYLDGIYYTVRHGTQTDSTVILTALGVDMEGKREVLALRVCAEESKDGWSCLVRRVGICSIPA
jgi:transposase-like protein